jgi:hypothetical protein
MKHLDHYCGQVEPLSKIGKPFAQLHLDRGMKRYVGQSQQSRVNFISGSGYQILGFHHVGALETSDDGDVDGLICDCVNKTLCNRVTAHNTTLN